VVERRQTLPILSNVLIRLQQGELSLAGTDLEVEVIVKTRSAQGSDGELTVPARKLLDICRALPAQAKIDIKLEKEKAVIKSGRSRFTLMVLPASDFPSIEAAQWERSITLPQKALKELLEKTQFCMAQQDVRYYLNGLLLEVGANKLRAVATDGHRMAMSEAPLGSHGEGDKQVIVPRKGVQELTRFLESSDETVDVLLGSNHLRVVFPNLTFTSKLIDGRFPDYNKVIPQKQTILLKLDRDLFRETLNRAAILSNEKYRGVRFSIAPGTLRVTAHNPEQEEAQEELAIDYQGGELDIGFNVTYISDAIGALDSTVVEFGLSDANSSCTLRSPDEHRYQYVVMPMRL
jgi:DNA polymerase-3 subunit beta